MTVEFLVSGSSWTVPSGVTDVQVECLGPGGNGGDGGIGSGLGGSGGGGGAYAKKNSLSVTPGGSVSYQLGAGGSGTDVWFSSSGTVLAKAGANASGTTLGAGGASGSCIGDTVYSGGSGAGTGQNTAGGGGGSAGPTGVGKAGAQGSTASSPGGGGGGSNGGSSSAGTAGSSTGAGGNGTGGSGGGAGVSGGNPGNAGTSGGGGSGGRNSAGSTSNAAGKGGDGGSDTAWDGSHGAGGGGGGGSATTATGGSAYGGDGGAGGTYGGGGGGGGRTGTSGVPGTGGTGGAGLIILTYTAAITSTPGAGSLAITAYSPTVASSVTSTPGSQAVALTGYQPTAASNALSTPGSQAVAITAYSPSVTISYTSLPSSQSVTITGYQPLAESGTSFTVTPGAGSLALTGFIPSISSDAAATPGAGALALTGLQPVAELGYTSAPTAGSLAITAYAPTITSGITSSPGAGALALTGFIPSVSDSDSSIPGTGTLTITGLQPTTAVIWFSAPGAGALTITAFAPSVTSDVLALVGAGSLTLTGFTPTTAATRIWSINSSDTTELALLKAPQAMKGATGNGTTTQESDEFTTPSHMLEFCEPNYKYRVACRLLHSLGYTGQLTVYADFYDRDLSVITPSGNSQAGTNYRTSAAGSDTVQDINFTCTAPAGACYVGFRVSQVWSTTQSNAARAWVAHPRIERAASRELIPDGEVLLGRHVRNAADTTTLGDTDLITEQNPRLIAGLETNGDVKRAIPEAIANSSNILRKSGGGGLYTGPLDATRNAITRSGSTPGSPAEGDIWVDTSTTLNVTKVYVSGAWQSAATLDDGRLAAGLAANGDVNRAIPTGIKTSSSIMTYSGGGTYTGDLAATKNTVTRSGSTPGSPANGDIWVDTSTTLNVTKVYVSGAWQSAATLDDGRLAAGLAANGDVNRAIPTGIKTSSSIMTYSGGGTYTGDLAATKNTVTRATSAPGSPANGDVWVDTSTTPNVTKVYVSGAFQSAASLGADWASTLYSRPTELTDGRITKALTATTGVLKAAVTKTTSFGNLVKDYLIQDSDYWAITESGTWTIDTSSSTVTGTGVDKLSLTAAFKTPTGVNSTTHAVNVSTSSDTYTLFEEIEPGTVYHVSCRRAVSSTFRGQLRVGASFWKRNNVDGSVTLLPENNTIVALDTDYRSAAPGGGVYSVADIKNVIRAPLLGPTGTFTLTSTTSLNTQTVTIQGKVYTFKTTITTADGDVLIGASTVTAIANLVKAINLTGVSGTDYGSGTLRHASVYAQVSTTNTSAMIITANEGVSASAVATTDTCTNGSWGAATLVADSSTLLARFRLAVLWHSTAAGDAYMALPVMRPAFDVGVWSAQYRLSATAALTDTTWTKLFNATALSTGKTLTYDLLLAVKTSAGAAKSFQLRYSIYTAAAYAANPSSPGTPLVGPIITGTYNSAAGASTAYNTIRELLYLSSITVGWVTVVVDINPTTGGGTLSVGPNSGLRVEDDRTRG